MKELFLWRHDQRAILNMLRGEDKMKIKKMKVGEFNLKKYLFLYFKGHLNNGLNLGQIDNMLKLVVYEVFQLFLLNKYQVDKKDYPYAFDKNGEQIGGKVEDYED